MKHPIKTALITLTAIAIIGYILTFLFGGEVTYISTYKAGNLTLYRYDFGTYIKKLNDALDKYIKALEFNLPTRDWIDSGEFFTMVWNNLLVILNYIIVVANIILYPFRIMAFMLKIIFTILGFNLDNSKLFWLRIILENIGQIQYL